ncbi:MAG: cobalt-precorrin-5B (C(1))-methyltransferase CbiD [Elainellaceae cyanobacterium]
MIQSAQSGYTLPVFACAAAVAALKALQHPSPLSITDVTVDLIHPAELVDIPIEQVAQLDDTSALAIARSQPGDNLDITRHTPIWAQVRWGDSNQPHAVEIKGGEGLGRQVNSGDPAIYRYAQQLLQTNLRAQLQLGQRIQVTVILPEGRQLAERTSNRAFGIVDGLSLLGTSGIAQPLSAPAQLEDYRSALRQSAYRDCVVLCLGENGLDMAQRLGITVGRTFKTANWIGPMLVEAATQNIDAILLLGYHGKLLKLAGGIFHTHHHLADARQEILAAYSADVGLPIEAVQKVLSSPTAEAALTYLRTLEPPRVAMESVESGKVEGWASAIYSRIASQIEQRSRDYIYQLGQRQVPVGCVLFNRQRQIVVTGEIAATLLPQVC